MVICTFKPMEVTLYTDIGTLTWVIVYLLALGVGDKI